MALCIVFFSPLFGGKSKFFFTIDLFSPAFVNGQQMNEQKKPFFFGGTI